MAKEVHLLHETITLEDALDDDDNMIIRLQWPLDKRDFFDYLTRHADDIYTIISHHLGLRRDQVCKMVPQGNWIHGSFNVCIPVAISNWHKRGVMLRCPLPYKLGGTFAPANVEEKLRCEAATFAWIEENCSELPIPYLYGFGLPNGRALTRLDQLPFLTRIMERIRRSFWSLLEGSRPSSYVAHQCSTGLKSGYLVMEYIERSQGRMLSDIWHEANHNRELRTNFFRGLSRITLSLARVHHPRIGSFTMDDHGFLSLSNRPLSLRFPHLENEGIPIDIPRDLTYSTVDTYISDVLRCSDVLLRHQHNSFTSEFDATDQMAVLTMMRAVQIFRRDLRHGPFVFGLTDLSPSNIFVDDQCNITGLVDLEWSYSLPVEMIQPPYWLTNEAIDTLEGDELVRYNSIREEYMDIFEKEEQAMLNNDTRSDMSLTGIMKKSWDMGTFWYLMALVDPKGTYFVFLRNIQPMYAPEQKQNSELLNMFRKITSKHWTVQTDSLIATKLENRENYLEDVRRAFDRAMLASEATAVK